MSPNMPDGLDIEGPDDPQEQPWDGVGHRPLPPSGEEGAHTAFQAGEPEALEVQEPEIEEES